MGEALYFVGPWDLDRRLPCIPRDPEDGRVLFVESRAKGRALPWHRQKLVLVLSAMRHFAAELERDGYRVEIRNARTYADGIREAVRAHRATRVVAMRPRELGIERSLLAAELGAPLELHDDGGPRGHFLLGRDDVLRWARRRDSLRMDAFYAALRRRTGWLMDAKGKPLGGRMSFDVENRRFPDHDRPPPVPSHPPDAITREVMERVRRWPGGWGSVEGFDWPVDREGALRELDDFFRHRAESFGPYEDAMLHGERWMWHARLSSSLNLGLLSPREVCERVVAEHDAGRMPLASAEGLLRQIAGWREYMRALYWLRMPELRDANQLEAKRALPVFYWEPERTEMRCMRECVSAVRDTGYAHHVQRLMVLGNFALLAGVRPLEVSHWFWAAYVDAYEWVQLPNVHAMALFADGIATTKPYAASGAYVDRMSDYCRECRYDVKARKGEDACPFNPLFWTFLERHRARFAGHPRIGALYRTWDRWSETEREHIRDTAARILRDIAPAPGEYDFTFRDDDG